LKIGDQKSTFSHPKRFTGKGGDCRQKKKLDGTKGFTDRFLRIWFEEGTKIATLVQDGTNHWGTPEKAELSKGNRVTQKGPRRVWVARFKDLGRGKKPDPDCQSANTRAVNMYLVNEVYRRKEGRQTRRKAP